MQWTVPKLWQGETVFIIGGGPSLRHMDLSPLQDRHVIGCNSAYMLGHWVDMCYFGDMPWYRWNIRKKEFINFPNLIISCASTQTIKDHKRIKYVMKSKDAPYGITTDPSRLVWNGNTGGSAVNLAYHLGASRIVLLGYDMKQSKIGESNWHNWHQNKAKEEVYGGYISAFKHIMADARKLNLEIINCTPDSALTFVPYIPYDKELERG